MLYFLYEITHLSDHESFDQSSSSLSSSEKEDEENSKDQEDQSDLMDIFTDILGLFVLKQKEKAAKNEKVQQ